MPLRQLFLTISKHFSGGTINGILLKKAIGGFSRVLYFSLSFSTLLLEWFLTYVLLNLDISCSVFLLFLNIFFSCCKSYMKVYNRKAPVIE